MSPQPSVPSGTSGLRVFQAICITIVAALIFWLILGKGFDAGILSGFIASVCYSLVHPLIGRAVVAVLNFLFGAINSIFNLGPPICGQLLMTRMTRLSWRHCGHSPQ